jgi:hypothetical protein
MAHNTQHALPETASATESSETTEASLKWEPYWDENYKRYYWSDGNESVIYLFYFFFYFNFDFRYGKHQKVVLNHHHLDLNHLQTLNNSIQLVNMRYQWHMLIHKVIFVINLI